jgi:hypothetical protein
MYAFSQFLTSVSYGTVKHSSIAMALLKFPYKLLTVLFVFFVLATMVRGQKGKSEKGKSKKAIAFLDLPFFKSIFFLKYCCLFGYAIF